MSDLLHSLPPTNEPLRIAVRGMRWFRAAFEDYVAAVGQRIGGNYKIDKAKLAAIFVRWLRAVERSSGRAVKAEQYQGPPRLFPIRGGPDAARVDGGYAIVRDGTANKGRARLGGSVLARGLRHHAVLPHRPFRRHAAGISRQAKTFACHRRSASLVVVQGKHPLGCRILGRLSANPAGPSPELDDARCFQGETKRRIG